MELWIRSQDRLTLKKVKEVYIAVRDVYQIRADYIPDLYENSGDCYTLLGEYQTKERAIEILDDIEKILTNSISKSGTYQESDIFVKSIIASNMYKIYDMPKE